MAKSISLKDLLASDEVDSILKELSFEDGLRLLDELVQRVETGSLPLDSAIKSYEKGVQLVEKLKGLLAGAEEKLKILQKNQSKK